MRLYKHSTHMSNGRFVQKTPKSLFRLRILMTFLSPSGLRYLRSLSIIAGGMRRTVSLRRYSSSHQRTSSHPHVDNDLQMCSRRIPLV